MMLNFSIPYCLYKNRIKHERINFQSLQKRVENFQYFAFALFESISGEIVQSSVKKLSCVLLGLDLGDQPLSFSTKNSHHHNLYARCTMSTYHMYERLKSGLKSIEGLNRDLYILSWKLYMLLLKCGKQSQYLCFACRLDQLMNQYSHAYD